MTREGTEKEKIREIIIVEGRDDTAAVRRALDAETIETHGLGMSREMWERIDAAYRSCGIIVFTDPDHAGGLIRRKITEKYPDCGQAYLPRQKALKNGDIGVENAEPEAIREALSMAHRRTGTEEPFSMEDLLQAGLVGSPGSRERRRAVCEYLGIGYGNAAASLDRLNGYGITKEEFYGALQSVGDPADQEEIRVSVL